MCLGVCLPFCLLRGYYAVLCCFRGGTGVRQSCVVSCSEYSARSASSCALKSFVVCLSMFFDQSEWVQQSEHHCVLFVLDAHGATVCQLKDIVHEC